VTTESDVEKTGSTSVAWRPRGGEVVVVDDLVEIDRIRGPIKGDHDTLLAGELTSSLITGLLEAGSMGDVEAAIRRHLPPLSSKRA